MSSFSVDTAFAEFWVKVCLNFDAFRTGSQDNSGCKRSQENSGSISCSRRASSEDSPSCSGLFSVRHWKPSRVENWTINDYSNMGWICLKPKHTSTSFFISNSHLCCNQAYQITKCLTGEMILRKSLKAKSKSHCNQWSDALSVCLREMFQ